MSNATPQYKSVSDINVKSVEYATLAYPGLDILIKTLESAVSTKISPIVDISTKSYTMAGKTTSGKVYETTLAILCTDGVLYRVGGSGVDEDIGSDGVQGGVKSPPRKFNATTIVFKTRSNKKLGQVLDLYNSVLYMDANQKLENGTIVSKKRDITEFVKTEIGVDNPEISESVKREYVESKDYMVRMNIVTKGPMCTRILDDVIVNEKISGCDIDLGDGTFIHTTYKQTTYDDAHLYFTRGMGLESFRFGCTRKVHSFGISYNLYLVSCYIIPRKITMDETKHTHNDRDMEKRIAYAKAAGDRAKTMSENTECIKRHVDKSKLTSSSSKYGNDDTMKVKKHNKSRKSRTYSSSDSESDVAPVKKHRKSRKPVVYSSSGSESDVAPVKKHRKSRKPQSNTSALPEVEDLDINDTE